LNHPPTAIGRFLAYRSDENFPEKFKSENFPENIPPHITACVGCLISKWRQREEGLKLLSQSITSNYALKFGLSVSQVYVKPYHEVSFL
jgi:hypothetical protein